MNNIISKRRIIADDWQTVDGESGIEQLPAGKLIVPMTLWQEHQESLSQRDDALGIRLNPDDDVDAIAAHVANFDLVVLHFPSFRDGRAYSQARSLRLHHGYEGDIRASGNVLRDQMMYMERVGFTSFELDDKQDINDALKAFDEISVKYQASSDEALPLYQRRSA